MSQIIDDVEIAATLKEIAKGLRKMPNKKEFEEKFIEFARLHNM